MLCAHSESRFPEQSGSHPSSGLIGVLDSGVGGMTVLVRLVGRMPHRPYVYFADTAWCPYGPRPRSEVAQRTLTIAEELLCLGCSMIVVACNTATSAAITLLRERLPVPIVGMEPAVKPAVLATRTGHIAVLGTRGTLQGDKLRQLEMQHAGHVTVHHVEGAGLVELVESEQYDSPATAARLQEIWQPLRPFPIDQVVLGCTHYPFIRPALEQCLGSGVGIVDPADAVAARAVSLAEAQPLSLPVRSDDAQPSITFLSSAGVDEVPRMQRFYEAYSARIRP